MVFFRQLAKFCVRLGSSGPAVLTMEKSTFAAGCFWGVEETFRRSGKVLTSKVGYTGGTVDNPDYKAVCTGATGHAEAVEVTFDPSKTRYADLLQLFWETHDPTTKDRQGPDHGTQYRSAIFFHSAEQENLARQSLAERQKLLSRPIVTEIIPAGPFYDAEEYHQQYIFKKKGPAACAKH